MGGLPLGVAESDGHIITLPVRSVLHGSYLVVIRGDEGDFVYKIAL
jgi:hypothetical protein